MYVAQEVAAGSPALKALFVALTALIAVSFVAAVNWSGRRMKVDASATRRRTIVAAAGALLWIGVTGALAARGALHFQSPPTMLPVFPAIFVIAMALAFSPIGRQIALGLPLAALVGYQSFRVIVELLLHRAYTEGLMPVQMSYSGRNFDIISGLTAIALGAWLATGAVPSRRVIFAWNTLGLGLLINIVGVALLSSPTPFRVFMNEPSNVWVTQAPWVWLPTVMVFAALLGHIVVYRRLAIESKATVPVRRSTQIAF